MASLFGEKVLNSEGTEVDSSTLKGKTLGLYFSAHWCPPCRAFTPQLVSWFSKFKENSEHKDEFEIVFVSADRDEGQFKEYFGEMTGWHAIPYADKKTQSKLNKKCKVQGIPMFVIIDADGNVLTDKGRSIPSEDPEGKNFPWPAPTLKDILPKEFVNTNGEKVAYDPSKVYGIYFSASWCGPCKMFTPKLAKVYEELKGKNFEIVFCSRDKDAGSFQKYFSEMPWLAIDFEDRKASNDLMAHFGVEGIPTLVIIDEELNTITTNGRGAISSDPKGENFPWKPKPLNELTEGAVDTLNGNATLVAFTDASDEEMKEAKEAMEDVANAEAAAAKESGQDQELFFLYTGEEDIVDSIRDFAKIGDESQLVLINIPEQEKYVAKDPSFTADNVKQFVADYKAGKLSAQKLR